MPCYNRPVDGHLEMERAAFAEQVHDALAHLYDHVHLQHHPLARLLAAGPSGTARGRTLHRLLLEAIGQLKPSRDTPHLSTAWRKYQYFFLRYVEGRSALEAAEELAISERQSRRYHRESLEAVTAILWESYRSLAERRDGTAPTADFDELDGSTLGPREWRSLLKAEVARLESRMDGTSVAVPEVTESVVKALANLAESKAVRVSVHLDHDLPPVAADRVLLRQVLFNLLTYTIRRCARREVVLRGLGASGAVRLEIEPAGQPPEDELGDPISEDDGQLEAARQLLAGSRGTLDLLADGRGWLLRLTLPSIRPCTVLVIDDNPDIAQLFRRFLGGRPYQVLAVNTSAEALEAARRSRPDIITLDVMMPAQDGWELLQTLRNLAETRDVPIVVCSVLRERDLALSLGATGFLAKPVTQQALLTALDRCLADRATTQSPA